MTENVETRAGLDSGWHGPRVERITDAERGLQVPVRNARLGSLGNKIKDGGSCRLAARTSCGRNGDERRQLLINRATLAEGRIDEIQKIGIGVCGIKVHQLGRINDRAAAHGQKCIWLEGPHPLNCFLDAGRNESMLMSMSSDESSHLRAIFWFHSHVGEDLEVDALSGQSLANLAHGF